MRLYENDKLQNKLASDIKESKLMEMAYSGLLLSNIKVSS